MAFSWEISDSSAGNSLVSATAEAPNRQKKKSEEEPRALQDEPGRRGILERRAGPGSVPNTFQKQVCAVTCCPSPECGWE